MGKKNLLYGFFFGISLVAIQANAQLQVNGAGALVIQSGAVVNLQGNLSGTTTVGGSGKITLTGVVAQNVSMNDLAIPNLEINNTQNVYLTSNGRIQNSLNFVNGKIIIGNYNLTLSSVATSSGMGTGKFIETNSTGQVFKELSGNVTSYEIPVGVSTVYRPVLLTTTATVFNAAKVGVKALAIPHLNRPAGTIDYLNAYWPMTRTGITGTVNVTGRYTDPTDIVGTEVNLRGFFYDGSQWSSTNGTNDAVLNRVGAPVTGTGGSLYGMGLAHTVALNLKLYLQGYYNSGGLMKPVLTNQGLNAQLNETDSILVELHDPATYALVSSKKAMLLTNGTVSASLTQIPGLYYIAIKHRNSLQTWSANPVTINATSSLYDFSLAANKAMNNSQVLLETGRYAFFTGDLNQDDFIDSNDFPSFDNDVFSGVAFIYVATDLNGDGFVDSNDFPVFDQNNANGIYAGHP